MLLKFAFTILIASARDPLIGVSNFGTVKMPSQPLQPVYSQEEQQKTYNVIVPSIVVGSSPKKIHDELAQEFSTFKWPDSGKNMFNVTLLTSRDNQKSINKKSETFTPFILPYNYSDYFDHNGPNIPKMVEQENKMIDMLVKSDSNEYKNTLHSVKFDAGFVSLIPSERIIAKMHDVPLLQWCILADPIQSVIQKHPWDESTTLPMLTPSVELLHSMGHQHVLYKSFNHIFGSVLNFVFDEVFFHPRRFQMTIKGLEARSKIWDDIVQGEGIRGVTEQKQEAQNIFQFYPLAQKASKFGKKGLELPKEYQEFVNNHKANILVGFGTTWSPQAWKLGEIVKAAKALPDMGFIISLQEKWPSYKLVQEANLKNILLKKFVPQTSLLNNDKVIAFISHAGYNSVVEAMYYGKFFIGFPTTEDQPGNAYKVEIMKAGISMQNKPNHEELIKVFKNIQSSEENSLSDHMRNVKRNQKKMEFTELRSGQTMKQQLLLAIKYQQIGGNSAKHRVNFNVINNSTVTVYDYDIKCVMVIMLILLLSGVKNLLSNILFKS